MSRIPDGCPKISLEFQKRLIAYIKDEDCDENGKICTNSEFAKRAGVNKNVISNIVNYGIIPSVNSLIKIADYLNVSLEYLLCKTDSTDFIKSGSAVTFHDRLLQLKEENDLNYADITNKTSFARNSIHVWIKRKNLPTLDYLFQLADFFNVSVDYLLGRTDYRD